jgi:hypothetical protein
MNGIAQGLGAALSGYVQGRTARADLDDRRRQIALQEKDQAERMGLAMRGQESQERQALANTELERAKMEEEYLSQEESDRMWRVMLPPADFAILFRDGKTVRMKKSVVNSWILAVGLRNSENKASTVDFGAGTGGGGGTVPTVPGVAAGGPTTGVVPTAPAPAPGPAVTPGSLTTATAGAQPPPGAPAAPQAPQKMNNAAAMAWYQQEVLPYFTPTDDAKTAVKGPDGSPVLNLLAGTAGQKKYLAANHTAFGNAKMGRADIQAKVADVAGKIAQQRGTPAATAAGMSRAVGQDAALTTIAATTTPFEMRVRPKFMPRDGQLRKEHEWAYDRIDKPETVVAVVDGVEIPLTMEMALKLAGSTVSSYNRYDPVTGELTAVTSPVPISVEEAYVRMADSLKYRQVTLNVNDYLKANPQLKGTDAEMRLRAHAPTGVVRDTPDAIKALINGALGDYMDQKRARELAAQRVAERQASGGTTGSGGPKPPPVMTENQRRDDLLDSGRMLTSMIESLKKRWDDKGKFHGPGKEDESRREMDALERARRKVATDALKFHGINLDDAIAATTPKSEREKIYGAIQSGYHRVKVAATTSGGIPTKVQIANPSNNMELTNDLIWYVMVERAKEEGKAAGSPQADKLGWWADAKIAYYITHVLAGMDSTAAGETAEEVIREAKKVMYSGKKIEKVPRDIQDAVRQFIAIKQPPAASATGAVSAPGGISGMAFGGDE